MCVRFRVNRTQIFMLIFINFIVAPEKVFLISFPVCVCVGYYHYVRASWVIFCREAAVVF